MPMFGIFYNEVKKIERYVETERLIIRPLTVEEEDVFQWASDPIVNRFLPYDVYESVE